MPELNKPITTTRIYKTREVKMEMSQEQRTKLLFQYLRKYYPNLRGFDLGEINMVFQEDGNVIFYVYKEINI